MESLRFGVKFEGPSGRIRTPVGVPFTFLLRRGGGGLGVDRLEGDQRETGDLSGWSRCVVRKDDPILVPRSYSLSTPDGSPGDPLPCPSHPHPFSPVRDPGSCTSRPWSVGGRVKTGDRNPLFGPEFEWVRKVKGEEVSSGTLTPDVSL